MKLKSVVIENFKNYAGRHVIDVSTSITIFYGPNGYGKSTFFDALEWGLAGTVGRFGIDYTKSFEFIHERAYRSSEACSVELEFDGFLVRRWVPIRNGKASRTLVRLIVDGQEIAASNSDMETALRSLLDDRRLASKKAYPSFLCQTHILSQDQINQFISNTNAKGRFEIIAEIMGMNHVVERLAEVDSVIKHVDTAITMQTSTLSKVDERKKLKEQGIVEIDTYAVKLALRVLGHPSSLKEFDEQSVGDVHTALSRTEDVISTIISLQKEGFHFVNEVSSKVKELSSRTDLNQSKVTKYRRLVEKLKSLEDELSDTAKNLRKIADIDKEIQKIINVRDALVKHYQGKEQLMEWDLNALQDKSIKLDFALLHREDLKKGESILVKTPSEIVELLSQSKFLSRRSSRINRVLGHLSDKITQDTQARMLALVSDLEGIQSFLQGEEQVGTCPVCSSEHDSDLLCLLHDNIRARKSAIEVDNLERTRVLTRKNYLEAKLTETLRAQSTNSTQAQLLQDQLKRTTTYLNEIKSNRLYDRAYLDMPDQALKEERKVIKTRIDDRTQYRRLENELSIKQREKSQLLGTNVHSLVAEDYAKVLSVRIRRLQLIQRRSAELIQSLTDERKNMSTLSSHLNGLLDKLSDIGVAVSFNDHLKHLRSLESKQHQTLRIMNRLIQRKVRLKDNTKIENELRTINTSLQLENAKLENLAKMKSNLTAHLQDIRDRFGSQITQLLNGIDSRVQAYFRYMNPLPTTVPITFEDHVDGDTKELEIMVPFSYRADRKSNAKYMLSSGQMNVLALAIFLSMNFAPNVSKLGFVAIDDPIQNMDDVNKFSVCDVLGGLEKQLFFSTHDFDFLNLFIRKNEHRRGDIQVYILESTELDPEDVRHLSFGTNT